MKKDFYKEAEFEVISFDTCDIITTSDTSSSEDPSIRPPEKENQGDFIGIPG